MPIKPKKTVKIAKGSTQGMGFLSWERLEQRFREIGELTDKRKITKIYLDEDGIYYSTAKK